MGVPEHRLALGPHLFELVPDPLFLLDGDGVFRDLNRAAARYLRSTPEALLGRSVREVFPPEQAQRQLDVVRTVVETGEPFVEERTTPLGDEDYVFQYVLRRVDGPEGDVLGVLGMVRDVTSLVTLERLYGELYEGATDALFAVDPDGRIRALNREAELLSGRPRDRMENLHFSDVIAPEEVERLRDYFEARLRGGAAPTEYETRFVHADGAERWVEVHISQEPSSVGVFQASVRDITDRKRVEAVRRDFLHVVSHDVQAPLTVIQGFASALSEGLYGRISGAQEECLGRIVDASRKVRHLMEQFLLAERLDAEEPWPCQPGEVTGLAERAVGLAVPPEAAVTLDLGDCAGVRVADAEGAGHILDNLLSNAVKFSPPAGRIRVRARREGDQVRVEVEDEGLGIPEADLGRVFERFFRAANSGGVGGSGLGLYITRRLAERAGGRVAVASRPGAGTRFTVWLPTAP